MRNHKMLFPVFVQWLLLLQDKAPINSKHQHNNDRLFPEKYTVKDHISNTKLEKGDHYYIQTLHKDLFSH